MVQQTTIGAESFGFVPRPVESDTCNLPTCPVLVSFKLTVFGSSFCIIFCIFVAHLSSYHEKAIKVLYELA